MTEHACAPELASYVELNCRLARTIAQRGFEDGAAKFHAVGDEHGFHPLTAIRRWLDGDQFRLRRVLQCIEREDADVRPRVDNDAIGGAYRIDRAIENQPERGNVGLL